MDKLKELKAQAYDAITQIEMWQNKLRECNEKIAEELKKEEIKQPN